MSKKCSIVVKNHQTQDNLVNMQCIKDKQITVLKPKKRIFFTLHDFIVPISDKSSSTKPFSQYIVSSLLNQISYISTSRMCIIFP